MTELELIHIKRQMELYIENNKETYDKYLLKRKYRNYSVKLYMKILELNHFIEEINHRLLAPNNLFKVSLNSEKMQYINLVDLYEEEIASISKLECTIFVDKDILKNIIQCKNGLIEINKKLGFLN